MKKEAEKTLYWEWRIFNVKDGTALGYIKQEKGIFYAKRNDEHYIPFPSFTHCKNHFEGYVIGGNTIVREFR